MKNMAQLAVICFWFFIWVAPEASAAETMSRITGQEIFTILKEEGYSPSLVKPSVVAMKIEGMKTAIIVADDNESIQSYTGFKSKNATLHEVNEWNKKKRFSRAYLDNDGDLIIELDLDLSGGISKERIIDFVRTVRTSVPAFVKQFRDAGE